MEVIIANNADEVAFICSNIVCELIQQKKSTVLGLATGNTPLLLYQKLIDRYQKQEISFAKVVTFNLDEYVGLPENHPQSYYHFMNHHLFDHIDIDKKNTHLPDVNVDDIMMVSEKYEEKIKQFGGIDLQILGIGANGHIGFNEPTSSLGSRTRIKTLTEQTKKDNSRFFQQGEFQPELAITMGIGTIMESRRILLLATGKNKAKAIVDTVEGSISAMCPASVLQMHPRTTVVIDQEAAQALTMKDYYKQVYTSSCSLKEKRNKQ